MQKKYVRIFLVMLPAFIAGCASRKDIVAFKNDTLHMRLYLEEIRQENAALDKKLQEINNRLARMEEANRQNNANFLAELATLKNQAQFMDNKLEDTNYRVGRLLHSVDRPAPRPATNDTLAGSDGSSPVAPPDSLADTFNPKSVYDAAYLDYSKGNHDLALQGFQEYLRAFPQSEFADNAQYWIGEIIYARRDYQTALAEFQKVILNYPKGAKVAAATLKIGLCRLNMNDKAGAKRYFDVLIEQFPDTEEAAIAKRRLQEIGAGKK